MDPNRSPDVVVDESCWSDLEFCQNTKNWYCYGKAVAEQAAWDEAKARGVDLVAVKPVLVLGPLLQPTVNASIVHILKYLTGSAKTYANSVQAYVHVRDVSLAHILLFETPSASGDTFALRACSTVGRWLRYWQSFSPSTLFRPSKSIFTYFCLQLQFQSRVENFGLVLGFRLIKLLKSESRLVPAKPGEKTRQQH